jgi:hypothetical protein
MCFLFFSLIAVSSLLNYKPKSDPNLMNVEQGKMSIVHYKNHSYIVWSINLGGGIVHNPDCECLNKN